MKLTWVAWRANIIREMKKYICAFLMALILPVTANAYVPRDTAVIRIMNKAAGKVRTINVPVGRSAEFEKLNLVVRSCQQTDPFQAEDFFMFIEISQNTKIFSGWMSRNEPGANPLQHPDYDVWLVRCE